MSLLHKRGGQWTASGGSPQRRYPQWVERLARWGTVVGVAVSMIGGLVLGMGSAQADTSVPGHGPGQYVTWSNYEDFWVGAYNTSNGLAFCGSPTGASPTGHAGTDPYPMTGWQNSQGDWVSAQQLAEIAYIMWWAGPSPSDYAAGMAKLAMLTVAGYTHTAIFGTSWNGYNFDVFTPGSDGQEIARKLGMLGDVQDLVYEARAKANTWDGWSPKISTNLDQVKMAGDTIVASVTLTGIPAGYTVTFIVTKPDGSTENVYAPTDSNGTAQISYQTSRTMQGTYNVKYYIDNIPPSTPLAFTAGGSNPQDLFFAAPSPQLAWDPYGGTVNLRLDPEVSTQASAMIVTAGDILTDKVKLDNLVDGLDWTLDGTLFGPVDAVNESCEAVDWTDAPVATEFTMTLDNSLMDENGTMVLSGLGPWPVPLTHENYCMSYAEHVVGKDPSTGEKLAETDHPVGSPDQTAMVEKRIPEVSSKISNTSSLPGEVLTDTGVVTNVVLAAAGATYDWTYTGTLYGPITPGGSWKDAPVAKTWTQTLTGKDVAKDRTATLSGIGRFTIPLNQPAGCYSYAAQVDMVGSDGLTVHLDHPVGDPAQTTCTPNGVLSVGTQVSDLAPIAGQIASDTVHATGVVPSFDGQKMTWTIDGRLYGPLPQAADKSCRGLDWSTAPVVKDFTYTVKDSDFRPDTTLDVSGLGPWTVPVNEDAKCVVYGETLTGVSADGLTKVSMVHAPGDAKQTATIPDGKVTLKSQALASTGLAGDTLSDAWSMTGLIPSFEGSPVTWTIAGDWYTTGTAGNGTCAGVDWSAAAKVDGGRYSHTLTAGEIKKDRTATVTGLGKTLIGPYEATACYSSSGELTGTTPTGWSIKVPHAVGDPNQTVALITHEVTIGTQVSEQTSLAGDTITDAVHATGVTPMVGDKPVTWTITGSIYTGLPDMNNQCALVEWDDTPVHEFTVKVKSNQINAEGVLDLDGIGSYTIPALDPTHCLTYEESLTGVWDGGKVTVGHQRGDVTQTTLVADGRPTIETQISTQAAMPGDTITDMATITGLVPQVDGKDVAWTVKGVLAQADPVNDSCESVDWSAPTVVTTWDQDIDNKDIPEDGTFTINGMGSYTIPLEKPAQCFSYGETLVGVWKDQDEPFTVEHELGKLSQTVLVPSGLSGVIEVQSGGGAISAGLPLVGAGLVLILGGLAIIAGTRKQHLPYQR